MKRLHLIELEDLPWVPAAIRDGGTDLLDTLFDRVGFHRPLASHLAGLLDRTKSDRIVDLCSGGGGGALAIHRALVGLGTTPANLVLTDRFPNAHAMERVAGLPSVSYQREPLDALAPRSEPSGVLTMSGALHHFRPEQVRQILSGAIAAGGPFAFFDVAASPILRAVPTPLVPLLAVPNFLMLFVLALFLTPFVRPVRPSRLALTYLVPAIPFLFGWDGTVSAMRAYAPEELLALAREVPGSERYALEAGREGNALFLIGEPRATG